MNALDALIGSRARAEVFRVFMVDPSRAYYQLDTRLEYYEELRAFILKTCSDRQQLRAALAGDPAVRLAFLNRAGDGVLVVTRDAAAMTAKLPAGYEARLMPSDTFSEALTADPESLEAFLSDGEDLLGRRDDMIWHWIETAGFSVRKGADVP